MCLSVKAASRFAARLDHPRFQSHFHVKSWLISSPIQVNSFSIPLINADME
jgi:hypothetical protein